MYAVALILAVTAVGVLLASVAHRATGASAGPRQRPAASGLLPLWAVALATGLLLAELLVAALLAG
jgi:hypothetical protein